jgi:hypothetical protein
MLRAEAGPAETATTATAAIAVRRAAVAIGISLFKAWPHTLELVVSRSSPERAKAASLGRGLERDAYGVQAVPTAPQERQLPPSCFQTSHAR